MCDAFAWQWQTDSRNRMSSQEVSQTPQWRCHLLRTCAESATPLRAFAPPEKVTGVFSLVSPFVVQVPESTVLPSDQMAAGGHLLDASPAVQSQALGHPSWGAAAAAGESLLKRTPLSAQRRQSAVLAHRPSAQPFPPLADITNTTGDLMGLSVGALSVHFLPVDLVPSVPAPISPDPNPDFNSHARPLGSHCVCLSVCLEGGS